jgi:hypothetical protein
MQNVVFSPTPIGWFSQHGSKHILGTDGNRIIQTTWYSPPNAVLPTRFYFEDFFDARPEDIACFDVAEMQWRNVAEDNIVAYRYFFFDFPWIEDNEIFLPKDSLIMMLETPILPSEVDLDRVLLPYVHPDSYLLKTLSNDNGRRRTYIEMDPRGAVQENFRRIRRRLGYTVGDSDVDSDYDA